MIDRHIFWMILTRFWIMKRGSIKWAHTHACVACLCDMLKGCIWGSVCVCACVSICAHVFKCKRRVCACVRVCVFLFSFFYCERRERTFATLRSARHAWSPAPLSQKAVTNCLGHSSAWREARTDANGARRNRERGNIRGKERDETE